MEPVRQVVVFGRGHAIVIDGGWVEPDGGVRLVLDRYENVAEVGNPTCYSEAEIKASLLEHGVYEDQAEEAARLIWAKREAL